jgi:hypothetical protein
MQDYELKIEEKDPRKELSETFEGINITSIIFIFIFLTFFLFDPNIRPYPSFLIQRSSFAFPLAVAHG